jgi:hypothetical protein
MPAFLVIQGPPAGWSVYGPVQGTGATVQDAAADAVRQIAQDQQLQGQFVAFRLSDGTKVNATAGLPQPPSVDVQVVA